MSIYTQKVTEQLIDLYVNKGVSIEDIAAELSTKRRGVVAKLSSLGLYKKPIYVSKSGAFPIKKSEYIDKIAVLLRVSSLEIESFEKASKGALRILLEKLEDRHNIL